MGYENFAILNYFGESCHFLGRSLPHKELQNASSLVARNDWTIIIHKPNFKCNAAVFNLFFFCERSLRIKPFEISEELCDFQIKCLTTDLLIFLDFE